MLLENKALTTDQHVRYVSVTLLSAWGPHAAGEVARVTEATAAQLRADGLA